MQKLFRVRVHHFQVGKERFVVKLVMAQHFPEDGHKDRFTVSIDGLGLGRQLSQASSLSRTHHRRQRGTVSRANSGKQ